MRIEKATDTITLYNCDCMEFMKNIPDNYYGLAIVDPPYGIKINNNMGRRVGVKKSPYKKIEWDNNIPSKEYFKELFRVSKNQIIWGGNYFSLPPTKCFIVWRKPQFSENVSFAMAEYAWTSFNETAKVWVGMSNEKERFHPTQKPVKLYVWLLNRYAKQGDKILDTHFGSCSIGIACHNLGYALDACEIDEDYFDAAYKRLRMHVRQLDLFK